MEVLRQPSVADPGDALAQRLGEPRGRQRTVAPLARLRALEADHDRNLAAGEFRQMRGDRLRIELRQDLALGTWPRPRSLFPPAGGETIRRPEERPPDG